MGFRFGPASIPRRILHPPSSNGRRSCFETPSSTQFTITRQYSSAIDAFQDGPAQQYQCVRCRARPAAGRRPCTALHACIYAASRRCQSRLYVLVFVGCRESNFQRAMEVMEKVPKKVSKEPAFEVICMTDHARPNCCKFSVLLRRQLLAEHPAPLDATLPRACPSPRPHRRRNLRCSC